MSPRTASSVPCGRFPSRAAVSGLAGVESPAGLTPLTKLTLGGPSLTPPWVNDRWVLALLINLGLVLI